MTSIKTAADLRRTMEQAGAPAPVIDEMIRITAPARREQRVRNAMRAALVGMAETGREDEQVERLMAAIDRRAATGVADLPRIGAGCDDGVSGTPGDCACVRAAALCAVEAWIGVGGHSGAGGRGRSTDREAWARDLGTGRASASDGGAWDSAIAEAARRFSIAAGGAGGVEITCASDGLGARIGTTAIGVDWSPEQERAICVRGLAAALPDGHSARIDPLPGDCGIVLSGTVAEWATYLDQICRIMAEVRVESEVERVGLDLTSDEHWQAARDALPAHLRPWQWAALGRVRDAQRAASADSTATSDETAHIRAERA